MNPPSLVGPMARKAWSMLAAALMVASVLAGCAAPLRPLADVVKGKANGLTGMQADDAGAAVAHQWRSDAALLGMVAMENHEKTGNGSVFGNDPVVGDGRAPVWILQYGAPGTNLTYSLFVWTNGSVTHRNEGTDDQPGKAVTDWAVDSDAAVAKARGNATFQRAVRETGSAVTYYDVLRGPSDDNGSKLLKHSHWIILAEGNGTTAWSTVDALNGTVLSVGSYRMPSSGFGGNWGSGWSGNGSYSGSYGGSSGQTMYESSHQGRLDMNHASASFALPVAPNATMVRLCVTTSSNLGASTSGATLTLDGPDGRQVLDGSVSGNDQRTFEWSVPADALRGTYDVTIALDSSAPVVYLDYTLGLWVGVPSTGGSWGGNPYWGGSTSDACTSP